MSRQRSAAYLRVIAIAFELQLKQTAVDGFIIFTVLVQPLLIATLALWMLRDKGGGYAIFVIVGSGMTGLWSSLLFISGNNMTFERWMGTLETLSGVPTPMPVIVCGKTLANVVLSLVSMMVGYVLAALIFRFPLTMTHPLLFAVSLLIAVVAFVCFGLIIAPLFVASPAVQQWQNAMEFPMYILGGFLFPIALLPGWTTPLSYLLTPYWAARALHATSSGGEPLSLVLFCWLMMLAFSGLYLIASRWLFRVMIHRARVEATLGLE